MKNKNEVIKELEEKNYTLKSKTISHIILEGCDGVGKTTMLVNLLKKFNYKYVVYDRGDLSNLVYCKKYNRPVSSSQRNLPFLHVLLTCDKKELRERIWNRNKFSDDLDDELSKIEDQDLFIDLYKCFKEDYHAITLDVTGLTQIDACDIAYKNIIKYINVLEVDSDQSNWNEMYKKACDNLGLNFSVRANQPYINDTMFMSESTFQNGVFETFSDKRYPDNLIYSLAYSEVETKSIFEREIDFAYIINSKVSRRSEIIDYYFEFEKNNRSCLVSKKLYDVLNFENFSYVDRVFGDDFIKEISKAKATVYCSRDLEYLKLQTARLYESILANQIVFVDKLSDTDCEILKNIHGENQIVDLLYCSPNDICEKYDAVMSDKKVVNMILENQKRYFKMLKENLKKENLFNEV